MSSLSCCLVTCGNLSLPVPRRVNILQMRFTFGFILIKLFWKIIPLCHGYQITLWKCIVSFTGENAFLSVECEELVKFVHSLHVSITLKVAD